MHLCGLSFFVFTGIVSTIYLSLDWLFAFTIYNISLMSDSKTFLSCMFTIWGYENALTVDSHVIIVLVSLDSIIGLHKQYE